MRIEQSGAMANVTSVSNAGKARTDSGNTAVQQTTDQAATKAVQETSQTKKIEQFQDESAQAAQRSAEESSEEKEKETMRAIEQANKQIKAYGRKLEFSIHDETKEIMVKVINTDDDSIIREVPSEKVLDMVARMWDMAGVLVDEKR